MWDKNCLPCLSRRNQIPKWMKAKKSSKPSSAVASFFLNLNPLTTLTYLSSLRQTFWIVKACCVRHEIWIKSQEGEVRYIVFNCDADDPVIRVQLVLWRCILISYRQCILTSSRDLSFLGHSQHLHTIIWTSMISNICHQQVNPPAIVFIPLPR